jgi:hypothetical protein
MQRNVVAALDLLLSASIVLAGCGATEPTLEPTAADDRLFAFSRG